MSIMANIQKLDQSGLVDTWMIAFIVALLLFLGSTGFGVWAFAGKQDYKNNVDAKIAEAITASDAANNLKKDAEFAEKEKNPLRTYTGPAAYGSVGISYPKTWSLYVDESGTGNAPLDGSLNPGFVPGLTSNASIALKVQVLATQYSNVVKTFDQRVKTGKVKVTPFSAPKVPGVVGLRVDGEIQTGKQGSLIVFPIRDKTLQVWTEAAQNANDFNTIILPNLVFVP